MTRSALVIGNRNYKNINSLNNPINDARTISDTLKLRGFNVNCHFDLDSENFLKVINSFGDSLKDSNDLAVFYYAGHSLQLMDSNYLLPVDISCDLSSHENIERNAIYLGDATKALNKTSSEKIIILDACRNHDFTKEIIATNDIFNKGLCEIESSHEMAIIYSTQPGNTASDGKTSSKNGCFTEELSKNLRKYNLTLNEIIINTREAVLTKTNYKQIPWSSNSLSKDISLDSIQFPGKIFHELQLPSNGIDAIACSNWNIFIGTENRLLFIFNKVSNLIPIYN